MRWGALLHLKVQTTVSVKLICILQMEHILLHYNCSAWRLYTAAVQKTPSHATHFIWTTKYYHCTITKAAAWSNKLTLGHQPTPSAQIMHMLLFLITLWHLENKIISTHSSKKEKLRYIHSFRKNKIDIIIKKSWCSYGY